MQTNISNILNLKENGFVSFVYPPDLRDAVLRVFHSWKDFTALPEEIKKGLPYSSGSDGVGYEIKDGVGIKADRKENFDTTKFGQEWFRQNSDELGRNCVVSNFLQQATNLVPLIKPMIMDFARKVENAFGLEGFANEVDASEAGYFVRFIHYFGDRHIGDETATAHVDQSGFTLHLFESHPGLQRLTFDGQWVDMPVSEGETVIINAMQLQYRSGGDLVATPHRVVATPETAVGEGRYSAVCFIQLQKTPKYNKDVGGRLQEREPGFNFKIPYDEFARLFK